MSRLSDMVQFGCGSGNTLRSRQKIIPTRSASEGSVSPRLRFGLVCRTCYPLLNHATFRILPPWKRIAAKFVATRHLYREISS